MAAFPRNSSDNAQFQIPLNHDAEYQNIPDMFDVAQPIRTPERAVAPFQFVKDIENRIFAAREAVLAHDSLKNTPKPSPFRSVLHATGIVKPSKKTLHDLIERESYTGGSLVRPNTADRFWLDQAYVDVNGTSFADWYYMQQNTNVKVKTGSVIRFQTAPNNIRKIYNGHEVPLGPEEQLAFFETVTAYEPAVLDDHGEYGLAA